MLTASVDAIEPAAGTASPFNKLDNFGAVMGINKTPFNSNIKNSANHRRH